MGKTKNPVPLSVGFRILFTDSRYKVEVDHAAGTYKLIITDVEKIDGGKYLCQVVASPETLTILTADVDLKIRTSPVIDETSDQVISQEVHQILSCSFVTISSAKPSHLEFVRE